METTESKNSWCHPTAKIKKKIAPPHQKDTHTHTRSIVHSKKKLILEVYLTFFKCFERYSSFLSSSVKAAFVRLTFQFQVCSTLGKQLSLFRAKINSFAFSPTSKRLLQVCVVHIPNLPAAHKGQSPMTLHNNCTGAMLRGRQQKIRDVLV